MFLKVSQLAFCSQLWICSPQSEEAEKSGGNDKMHLPGPVMQLTHKSKDLI